MSLKYSHDTLKQSLQGNMRRYEAIALSMDISLRLEDFIDSKGVSKSELAEAAGVSPSYLSQVFRGSRLFNITMLAGIAHKYKLRFNMEIEEDISMILQEKMLPKVGMPLPSKAQYTTTNQFRHYAIDNWIQGDKVACGGYN